MRPVAVTSPTHALAVAYTMGQLALAVQLVNGTATTRALDSFIGHGAEWLVPVLMVAACAGVLTSVATMKRLADPSDALRMEGISWTVLAVVSIAYALSLTVTYGWSSGATTQTYAWSFGVGGLARVIQILRDLHHLHRAKQAGTIADPAPLGEPNTRGD